MLLANSPAGVGLCRLVSHSSAPGPVVLATYFAVLVNFA
jgi:hypothetical protein